MRQTHDLPEEIRALSTAPYPDAPPGFAIRAVLKLRRAIRALADRLVPAEVALFERSFGYGATIVLGTIARLGLADLLDERPRTAAELAPGLGVDADALHRLMRAAAHEGILRLDRDGCFSLTRLGRTLRRGQLLATRDWMLYVGSRSHLAAWADLGETVRTGKCAFERVHGTDTWAWFDAHPDEREQFARAMMGLTVLDAPVVAKLYPFAEVKTVCDVGGGRGTLLSELLVRHPHLLGVLCDAPGVVESARSLLSRRGVADRVTLVPTNFFEAVPPGADAYVLKHVLHDWDDARCRVILDTCRRAMAPGARLLLVEALVERHDVDNVGVLADLQMMVICGEGRERGRAEFARLLEASGFRPGRMFPSPTVSVIEGVAI